MPLPRLPVPSEPDRVVLLEDGALGWPPLVPEVALGPEAAVLLARAGESPELPVLVLGVADPVHSRVVADGSVLWVHEDDLKVLVARVLVHPVRVKDAEPSALAADLLLGPSLAVPLWLQLGDTLVHGLSVHDSLRDWLLPSTAPDAGPVHNNALLGLVPEPPGLIRPAWASQAADGGQLPVLPAPHAQQKTQHVGLLLAPQLLDVLDGIE